MAVTHGKLQFEDSGANVLEITLPWLPVESTINLPIDITKLDDNSYSFFDHGTSYDKRSCECTLQLPLTEAENFNDFFGGNLQLGRAYNVTMRMDTDSGFFPFGADKGDKGDFSVVVTILEPLRMVGNPFKYHRCKIRIDNVSSWPTYSIPSKTEYGKITLGTVTNLYFPKAYFESESIYNYHLTLTENSTSHWIDRSILGDGYETSAVFELHEVQCANILNYLTVTARSNTFTMTTGNQDYAFGVDKSPTGTYTCRLINPILNITHKEFNLYDLRLNLYLESIA